MDLAARLMYAFVALLALVVFVGHLATDATCAAYARAGVQVGVCP